VVSDREADNRKKNESGKGTSGYVKPTDGSLRDYYNGPLHSLMNRYYKRLAEFESHKDQPVAWITTMVPIEILYAADVFPFYPENYSALCAARGISRDLIQVAESKGIPRDLCGYATCNIGSVVSGKWAFGKGGVPQPDLLIATRLTCNIHLNWWTYLSRHFKVPLFIMDAPYRLGAQYEERDIKYFIGQLSRLVQFVEEQTRQSIHPDRLREVLDLSDQASLFWTEISLSRKTIPCPLGSRDVFSLMFPMVTLAGTPEAVSFYKDVAEELKRRVETGEENSKERYRLIWDLFPPWHDMKLLNLFEEAGAVFVIDFYADAFSGRLTNPDPFMALTAKYLYNPSLQRGVKDKKRVIERLVEDFHLDGAVFMSNRSCRYFSLGQMDLASYIKNELGLPVLMFDGDHMDPDRYSRERIAMQIETFLELLSEKKKNGTATT